MASLSGNVTAFPATWLFWCVVLTIAYVALLFGVHALLTAHDRRQHARQRHRQELARIDRQATAAVESIYAGYAVTQKRIRDEIAQRDATGR